MDTFRRQVLRVGALSLGGGAALATFGTRGTMRVEAATGEEVAIETDDGEVESLLVDGLDVEFSWKGIEDYSENVGFDLYVRLAGPDGPSELESFDTPITSGVVELDAEKGGGTVGEDVMWATDPRNEDGEIDLLTGDGSLNASDLSVAEGDTNEYDIEFKLDFTHAEASASDTVTVPLTVSCPVPTKVVDDFEDNDISEYTGHTGYFRVQSSRVKEGSYALRGDTGATSADESGNSRITSLSGLDDYPVAGDTFEVWMYLEGDAPQGNICWGVQDNGDKYELQYRNKENQLTLSSPSDAIDQLSPITLENAWYLYTVEWDESGDITATVEDESGSVVATLSITDDSMSDGGIQFRVNNNGGQATSVAYWDGFLTT